MCRIPDVISELSTFGTTLTPPQRIPLWMVKFMSIAYRCQSPNIPDLTKLRLTLFEKLSKSKTDADIDRCLPPSAKALLPPHARASYQTIVFRKSCSAPPVILPDPTKFGWKKEGSNFVPLVFPLFRKPIKLTWNV